MLKGSVNGVQKDITRIAMNGKQLYDSAHSTAYAAVLDANNMWVNTSTAKSIKIRVEPSTQYTLSIDSPNNSIFRICESDNADITPQSASSAVELTRIVRDTTIKQYTFTTSNSAQCIIFQGSSASYERWNSTLMLNTGSTALDYESYGMQQGWEVRDQQGAILWGADKTLTGTNSIPMKGYGLPLVGMILEGNETQTGTPTPDSPIWPEECGDKTEQIIDYTQSESGGITDTGALTPAVNLWRSTVFYAIPNDGLSLSFVAAQYLQQVCINFYDASYAHISRLGIINTYASGVQLTIPENAKYFKWTLYASVGTVIDIDFVNDCKIMFAAGSTALDYEPYGKYKLPITLAGQTQNIYLDEPLRKIGGHADTVDKSGTVTRRIKERILTGTESWQSTGDGASKYNRLKVGAYGTVVPAIAICTHALRVSITTSTTVFGCNIIDSQSSDGSFIAFRFEDYMTLSSFKQFLADQYSAGTPVTVWYVLATPTTEQVTIPTLTPADGNDTLSVDTTLPPSKITITGHIKALT